VTSTGVAWLAGIALLVTAVGFVLALVTCLALIPLLKRLRFSQYAYEDAPDTHKQKTGTPTMGGLAFVVAMIVLIVPNPWLPLNDMFGSQMFALIAACAAIGFFDDYVSIWRGKNRGIRARTKLLLTALVAVWFLRAFSDSTLQLPHDVIFFSGPYVLTVPHWLWFVLGVIAITGTIHALNLTDGLDGLAAGVTIPPALVLTVLGFAMLDGVVMIGSLVLVGACLAFLIFNRYPAKLIMGDTGSLALGAALSGMAIMTGEMLLLIVIGGVYVAEALSVILQVAYFKVTHGKRIFRMSPLHHHFELSGWPETRVTTRFWIASALCSAVGLAIVIR
jgi:phospho-N-acetylmuramoyl-pentapeptide-transferase